jgi:ATP-dependent Clp protease ATP-binding subunit ClpC
MLSELKKTFRPEFINRVDEVIVFSNLTIEDVEQIVDLQMQEVLKRLSEYQLAVTLTPAARRWIAEQGYDPQFGARPLRRAIQRYVESPLSVSILEGTFAAGDHVLVDEGDDEALALSKQNADVDLSVTSEVAS